MEAVADEDVTDSLAMRLGNRGEGWVVGFLIPDKRTVRLDDDPVLVAEIDNFSLLRERVELEYSQLLYSFPHPKCTNLDLVDLRRINFRKAFQLFDMANTPVADPNGFCLATFQ